jgi:hypothetical protein
MYLKDHKHLINDISILEVLTYPQITWNRLYSDFVLWEFGYG